MIQVFSVEDRDKLIKRGAKLICTQRVGDINTYILDNADKLIFNDLGIKYKVTNRLHF